MYPLSGGGNRGREGGGLHGSGDSVRNILDLGIGHYGGSVF